MAIPNKKVITLSLNEGEWGAVLMSLKFCWGRHPLAIYEPPHPSEKIEPIQSAFLKAHKLYMNGRFLKDDDYDHNLLFGLKMTQEELDVIAQSLDSYIEGEIVPLCQSVHDYVRKNFPLDDYDPEADKNSDPAMTASLKVKEIKGAFLNQVR